MSQLFAWGGQSIRVSASASVLTVEYYTAIKKNENFAICNNMDGLGECYAKWNKPHRKREIVYDITYMSNLKNKTSEYNNNSNNNKTDSQYGELVVTSGEREVGQGIKR